MKLPPPANPVLHPVHWLEETVKNFYLSFISEGQHYHKDQLRVRCNEGVTILEVRASFRQAKTIKKRRGYFYVTFEKPSDLDIALANALRKRNDFKIGDNIAKVSPRPLLGFTKFCQVRPFFVKRVETASCVCQRCLGMKLLFTAMLRFRHWDQVCQPIEELLESAKEKALPFSATIDSVLGILLCVREENSFFSRKCCDGTCDGESCGWDRFVSGQKVSNYISAVSRIISESKEHSADESEEHEDFHVQVRSIKTHFFVYN